MTWDPDRHPTDDNPLDGAIDAVLIPDEEVADAIPDTDLESSPKNDPVTEPEDIEA